MAVSQTTYLSCQVQTDIERVKGLLLPGQRTNIVVSSFVDNASAANLNVGPSHLEHTLILHTALGKDHFISITGDYGE